jgi:hypothetical protein
LRWKTFETTLDIGMLRDHIARLPDFAEFDVLDKAFAHAIAFEQKYRALAFFLDWPRLDLRRRSARRMGRPPLRSAIGGGRNKAATILYRARGGVRREKFVGSMWFIDLICIWNSYRGQQKGTFMSDAYVIEVSGRTAGIVARDSNKHNFDFFSAARPFNAMEGQRFSDPLAAERVARMLAKHGSLPRHRETRDGRSPSRYRPGRFG